MRHLPVKVIVRVRPLATLVCVLLVATGCGRLGFDAQPGADQGDARADSGPGNGADASQPPGAPLPMEDAILPDSWTADVWVDFSAEYTYQDVQYMDGSFAMNNRPHHMALLYPPFEPGIALVGTWDIFEVRAPDVFVTHYYYPGSDDGIGPDAFFDAVFCDEWMGDAPGLCVAAGSQNGGDGIYRVEADWSISRISSDNNVGDIMYDRAGAFDNIGAPTVYWSGPDGLRRFNQDVFYQGMQNGAFTELLPDGDIITMHTDGNTGERRLVTLASTSHQERELLRTGEPFQEVARQHAGVYAIVAGAIERLGGYAYVIAGTRELIRIDQTGATEVIAEAGPGWRWTHAVVAPESHPLGADGAALYVLEFNPTTETNRIIRLRPTG